MTRQQLFLRGLLAIGIVFLIAGCNATLMPKPGVSGGSRSLVLGKNEHYAVVMVARGESFEALARRFLGDADKAWVITDANGSAVLRSGQTVIIPLAQENRVGVYGDGYQTVAVLSYHRLVDDGGKLSVSPRQFEEQMAFLRLIITFFLVQPLQCELAFRITGESVLPARLGGQSWASLGRDAWLRSEEESPPVTVRVLL